MNYRTDIDGLRAVAILSVVAFHYEIPRFPVAGGFVGVDIFFVISGYLITSIMYREIASGKFSLVAFYNRRIRRIFPALFVLLSLCLLFSAALSFPTDVKNLGHATIASVFFGANILDSRVGYFNQEAQFNPLTHIWSLSVEEQFYVLLPIVLYVALRTLNNATLMVAAIALASLAASIWAVERDPTADFFFVQYRAWELIIGALLGIGAVPLVRNRRVGELLGVIGLAAMAWAVGHFDGETPFPGWMALIPCLGAALVIYSGEAQVTLVGRLLSLPPVRFLGAISYSLYLWHWPVLGFYRLLQGEPHGVVTKGALITISALAAVLSWRFVEKPFREKPYRVGPRQTLVRGGLAMMAVSALALVAGPVALWRWNGPANALEAMEYVNYEPGPAMRAGTCFLNFANADPSTFRRDVCLAVKSGQKNFLLMGDSHAAHFWIGLSRSFPDVNFLQSTATGCKPLVREHGQERCPALMEWTFTSFLPQHHLDGVILSAKWDLDDLDAIKQTIGALRSVTDRIVVFGPIVQYDEPLPRLLAKGLSWGDPSIVDRHRLSEQRDIDVVFKRALEGLDVRYVSIYQSLCTLASCRVWASGAVPLQFDSAHLTEAGSLVVAERLGPNIFGK